MKFIGQAQGKRICLLLALILAGCGPNLGDYRVEDVHLVPLSTIHRIDPDADPEWRDAQVLRVVFSSATDVETASDGGDLYVDADFCPPAGDDAIASVGPYYGNRSRYADTREIRHTLPDGRIQIRVEGRNLHPPVDPRTGRYLYTAYLALSAPTNGGQFPSEAYDLRADQRDICLHLSHPGYYLTRSRSGIFAIPHAAVATALHGLD